MSNSNRLDGLDGRATLLHACQHLIARHPFMDRADIEACIHMTELSKEPLLTQALEILDAVHIEGSAFVSMNYSGNAEAFNVRLERYIYDRHD